MATLLIGILFAVAGTAMGLGCWYAHRALQPRADVSADPDTARR